MKKSTKTIVAVVTVAIAVLGLLALAGVFMNRANTLTTTEFFAKAGIVYEDNDIKFDTANKDNLEIKTVRFETYALKG